MKRSKWKGPLIKLKDLKKKLLFLPRSAEITSQLVGLVCSVHSGKKIVKLSLTNEMVGYKFGEFVPTRTKFEFKKKTKK
jgi:small subunit ribosomal protein S19